MFGYVERDGRRLDTPFLSGSWRSKIMADMPDGSHWTVFEVNPLPSGPNRYYLYFDSQSQRCDEVLLAQNDPQFCHGLYACPGRLHLVSVPMHATSYIM